MKYLIPTILFFISYSCNYNSISNSPKLDCSRIKDGVFRTIIDTPYYRGEITRTGDIQIEKDLKTGDSVTLKVKWINDCSYSLTYVSQVDTSFDRFKNKELIVDINKISGDTVYTTSHIPGVNFKADIKMIKIR